MKKILYAFSIGFFGACGYAIVNMLVAPKADPVIGLSFFAVIFVVCFIIGLFDYDRKMKKKDEEEQDRCHLYRSREPRPDDPPAPAEGRRYPRARPRG